LRRSAALILSLRLFKFTLSGLPLFLYRFVLTTQIFEPFPKLSESLLCLTFGLGVLDTFKILLGLADLVLDLRDQGDDGGDFLAHLFDQAHKLLDVVGS
jgi:hypothetical protein